MIFRPAKFMDIRSIRSLVELCCSSSKDYDTTGFVDFSVPSSETYSELIKSPYFFVGYDNQETVRCFVAGFPNSMIDSLDDVAKRIKQYVRDDFVYIDQLCVHPDFRNKKYGRQLLNFMEDTAFQDKLSFVYALVCLEPLNVMSLNLLAKREYLLIDSFQSNSLTFGVFEKDLCV